MAASIARYRDDVPVKISLLKPRAEYTHCFGHALNLACSITVTLKRCTLLQVALDVSIEFSLLIKESPRRRDALFQSIKDFGSLGTGVLRPTRWTSFHNFKF